MERAAAEADVVSCATLSTTPLIEGRWLKPGQHLDLVAAFSMSMREAADEALRRARVFVDTEVACAEGGDVAIGLASGVIARAEIGADLPALCRGAEERRTADEITLFKSVGAAIEDLAAAILVWRGQAPASRELACHTAHECFVKGIRRRPDSPPTRKSTGNLIHRWSERAPPHSPVSK